MDDAMGGQGHRKMYHLMVPREEYRSIVGGAVRYKDVVSNNTKGFLDNMDMYTWLVPAFLPNRGCSSPRVAHICTSQLQAALAETPARPRGGPETGSGSYPCGVPPTSKHRG